jgi:hypothetical protein
LEERGQRAEASSRIVIEEEDIYKKRGRFFWTNTGVFYKNLDDGGIDPEENYDWKG